MEKTNSVAGLPPLSLPKRLFLIFLRSFFKLLYHQFAWTYDGVASIVSLGLWQKWVQSVLPFVDGPRTLEIGYGPGHLLVGLYQKGIKAYGLDESNQMGKLAKKRVEHLGLRPNLIRGDAQTLPFADESLHQVVITFPAEYILKSATLSEIRRVLIKGGEALVLAVAWITGRMPWERAAAWVSRVTGEAPVWDESVLDPLKKVGFEVSWEMIYFPSSKIVLIRLLKS
jgi:ubiquinone/menaquinone biosynthesis C-methylase UbiE